MPSLGLTDYTKFPQMVHLRKNGIDLWFSDVNPSHVSNQKLMVGIHLVHIQSQHLSKIFEIWFLSFPQQLLRHTKFCIKMTILWDLKAHIEPFLIFIAVVADICIVLIWNFCYTIFCILHLSLLKQFHSLRPKLAHN